MNIHLFPFVPGTRQPEVARRCSWRSKLHTRNKQLFSSFSQKTRHKGALSSKRIDNTTAAAAVAKSSIKLYIIIFSPHFRVVLSFLSIWLVVVDRMWETSQLGSCWLYEDRFSRIFHTHHTHTTFTHTHTHTHVGTCSSESNKKKQKLCFEFQQNKNGGKPRSFSFFL